MRGFCDVGGGGALWCNRAMSVVGMGGGLALKVCVDVVGIGRVGGTATLHGLLCAEGAGMI